MVPSLPGRKFPFEPIHRSLEIVGENLEKGINSYEVVINSGEFSVMGEEGAMSIYKQRLHYVRKIEKVNMPLVIHALNVRALGNKDNLEKVAEEVFGRVPIVIFKYLDSAKEIIGEAKLFDYNKLYSHCYLLIITQ